MKLLNTVTIVDLLRNGYIVDTQHITQVKEGQGTSGVSRSFKEYKDALFCGEGNFIKNRPTTTLSVWFVFANREDFNLSFYIPTGFSFDLGTDQEKKLVPL